MQQQQSVTTDVITVSPATYARAAMTRLAERLWWVAVLPAAACAIAALHNPAYIFASFIWLLMLMPPAVMIAYYSYLLKPETASLSRPHIVTIDSHSVTITFTHDNNKGDNEGPIHADIYLRHDNLKAVIEKRGHLELDYKRTSPLPMLIIPYSAFTQGDTPQAYNILTLSVTNRR